MIKLPVRFHKNFSNIEDLKNLGVKFLNEGMILYKLVKDNKPLYHPGSNSVCFFPTFELAEKFLNEKGNTNHGSNIYEVYLETIPENKILFLKPDEKLKKVLNTLSKESFDFYQNIDKNYKDYDLIVLSNDFYYGNELILIDKNKIVTDRKVK